MPLPSPPSSPGLSTLRFENHVTKASKNAGEPHECDDVEHNLIFVDPNNWDWAHKSRETWELADEPWQEFRSRWYGVEPMALHWASLVDPKSPCFSLGPLHPNLDGPPSSILVRESCEDVRISLGTRDLMGWLERGHSTW